MIDWQPLRLPGGILSPFTKRSSYKGWTLTWYNDAGEFKFMAHISEKVLRAKSEQELMEKIEETESKRNQDE